MSPSIMRNIPATTENALDGLRFRVQPRPALVSLYASAATEGDTLSFAVDSNEFLVNGEPNVEAASGVVDVDRDQILFREPVPAGEYYLPATLTADVKYLLVIEQL